jgi:hypothetical protein
MGMCISAGLDGAVDFTLHLGDSGIDYARGVGEIEFARRLYRKLKDALSLVAKSLGIPVPEFLFFVEQGEGERPHLHGIIFLPSSKRHQRVIREALRDAVGRDWKPSGSDKTQLEFGTLYEPAGWVAYIVKFNEVTRRSLGDNIFASSRRITQQGREWYEKIREARGLLLPGKALPVH